MERISTGPALLTVLLEAQPLPAWACDAHGRIVGSNDAWQRFVGANGTLRTWWLSDRLLHPDDVRRIAEQWRSIRRRGGTLREDARVRRFDGAWTWHTLALAPLEHVGVADTWIGTWTSVEHLHGEDGAQLHERELERLRSEIVATVGHELRTPLTSIYGMAITLQRSDTRLSDAARSELLAVIVDQALRMTATIDDMLAAGTIERGRLALDTRPCDLAAVLREVVAELAPSVPDDVGVRVRRATGRVVARADEQHLRHVLAILVENAIKYSPGGGDIFVRIRRAGSRACVEVSDRGLGIPREEQPHVFERFHRLDPAHARGVRGAGLGLYIARELARRMDGDITVRSRPGRGSTFTLNLPAA